MTGTLACAGCAARYPIRRGIPRLIPGVTTAESTTTAARFAAEWQTFDHMSDYQEAWFAAWVTPLGAADFAGQLVLEGGCGKGRHTVVASDWGARHVVAMDLGDAVEVAFGHTRARTNAHVVQADLLHPPVKPIFDVAFSIGVLHHLPDPRAGFEAMRGRVRAGGKLAIWVYGRESNEWIVRYVNPLREHVTARMPAQLLYWLTLPPSAALTAFTRAYRVPPLAEKLPYRAYMKQLAALPLAEIHSIVYDQLVTPIAFYLPEDEVRSWFAGPRFRDVVVAWHNQNSWRGSAVVV